MGRLYQVAFATFLSMAGIALLSPSRCAGQGYCSLKVRVLTPDGQQLPVFVAVYEHNGRKLEKEQEPSQDLEFCDLGILPVKVVVGLKGCNQVTVDEVSLLWEQPYSLKIIYDANHCMHELPPPPKPVCQVLFRITGTDGKWISNAHVDIDRPNRSRLTTDSAGRAFSVMALNGHIRASVIADGYASKDFSLDCSEAQIEKAVALVKK